ncbi:hypothetical protein PS15p_209036 [Mucor circinelloides]
MKFWSSFLGRFFVKSGLKLKWGDTHLNNKGDESRSLKVDLRVLDDEVIQRYNQETEVAVAEFAKSLPGYAKFTSDRSKLQIEAKVVIDNHIRNDTNITSVESLQICGLEVFITNLKLESPGLYVGNEIYHHQIDASLFRFGEYLGLIAHLLCFRDNTIQLQNKTNRCRLNKQLQKNSAKSTTAKMNSSLVLLKSFTRGGTWLMPRNAKSPLSPPPSDIECGIYSLL